MKIRMVVTLDISPEGVDTWMKEYGIDRANVREDIKTAVLTNLQVINEAEVAGWQVTVR